MVVAFLTGPVVSVLIVRRMDHVQFGELAIATDAAGIAAVIATFGLNVAVTQLAVSEGTAKGDDSIRGTIATAVRVLPALTLATVPLLALEFSLFLAVPNLRHALVPLAALIPIVLISPALAVGQGAFQALHWARGIVVRSSLRAVVVAVATLVVLYALPHPDATEVAFVRGLGALLTVGVVLAPVVRMTRESTHGSVALRRLLTLGLSFLVGGTFGVILTDFDVVTLGMFHGSRSTGLYAPAAALIALGVTVPSVMTPFFLPTATRLAASGETTELGSLYRWSTRWLLALSAPVVAVFIATPSDVLKVVFGHDFSRLAPELRVMCIGLVLFVVTGFNDITLDAYGSARLMVIRSTASVAAMVLACFVLIPPFGILGAAWATAAGFVTPNLLGSVMLRRRTGIGPLDKRLATVMVAFAVGIGCAAVAAPRVPNSLGACAVAAAIASLVTWATVLTVAGPGERESIRRGIAAAFGRRPAEGALVAPR